MREPALRWIALEPGWVRATNPESPRACGIAPIDPAQDLGAPHLCGEEIDRALQSINGAAMSIIAEIRRLDVMLGDLRAEIQRRADRPPLDPAARNLDPAAVSRMERAVLARLAAGRSNREISNDLGITEKTVKNHLWKIYRKLGVKSRTQLLCRLFSP